MITLDDYTLHGRNLLHYKNDQYVKSLDFWPMCKVFVCLKKINFIPREVYNSRGFTLLEVLVALVILSLSLGVLLETQASSLSNAGRSRDISIATMLARAKMVDIEQKLFDDGFSQGTQEEKGNFQDEGYEAIFWNYKISEIELDLGGLSALCALVSDSTDNKDAASSCEQQLGILSGPMTALTDEISRSVRTIELTVAWPVGKYNETVNIRALVTREDFNLNPGGGIPQNANNQAQQTRAPTSEVKK